MKKIKLSPFIRYVLSTAGASILTVFCNIIVIRLLTENFGSEKFGAYSLANRILSTLAPFSTLNAGIALTRFSSITREESSRYAYLLSAFLITSVSSVVILAFGFKFAEGLTLFVFHDKAYYTLLLATLFLIVAYSFFAVLSGFYFGSGQISKTNLWQIFIGVIGPLLIVEICARFARVDLVIFLMGMLYLAAFAPLVFHLCRAVSLKIDWKQIKKSIKELFQYGSPRIPGGLAMAGLLSVGPFLAPHFGSLRDAGYLMVGQSILRVAEIGTGAFGLVVFPKVGQLFSQRRHEFLKERITDIVALVFHVGSFMILHLFLWADQIVLIWLGKGYANVIPLMRVFVLAIGPYMSYVMLYPVIDAIEVKAVNTLNLFVAFFVTLIFSLLAAPRFGAMGLAIGTVAGFLILSLFTLAYIRKICQWDSQAFMLKKVILLNTGLIIGAVILKNWLTSVLEGVELIIVAAAVETLFLLLYCFALWKLNLKWTVELEKRIIGYTENV